MVGTAEHLPRVVRISVTDADATDSSSDDERPGPSSERRRVKRFISHVKMERRLTTRRRPLKRKRRRGNAGVRPDNPEPEEPGLGKKPAKPNVCSSESLAGPFDSLFSGDFFACDVIVPSVLDLFADPGCEFGSLFFDTYSIPSSTDDFGFPWPADDHMLDVGEIFGSDPLVAI